MMMTTIYKIDEEELACKQNSHPDVKKKKMICRRCVSSSYVEKKKKKIIDLNSK